MRPQRFYGGFLSLTTSAVAMLAGCALGPNYKRPPLDVPETFRGAAATNSASLELAWWEVYQDEMLQAYVREALTNSYDIRIAAARVEQARALAMQARSQFVPSLSYNGIAGRGRNVLFGSPFPRESTANSAVATLNAFWEVDLWGRVRRLNESARAQFLASEEAQRGVRLTLLSDVAMAYFQLLELDRELEIANRTTNSFAQSLGIFARRLEGGTASGLESSRAEAAFVDAAAALPSIWQRIAITENQLGLLLGRNPGSIQRRASLLEVDVSRRIPAGLPSALLERRPDIRENEQLLRSANAQIGEATAEFFPKIGLTALVGKVSPELSAFTLGSANLWGIAAEGAGPLFQGGRLVGQYRQAKAARDEATLRYQRTVLTAFQEVSDALVTQEQLAELRQLLTREVNALEQAVKLSSERYVSGKASYYEVLEAQQQLFPTELNLARTQRDQLLAIVSLYKALGGGWQSETRER